MQSSGVARARLPSLWRIPGHRDYSLATVRGSRGPAKTTGFRGPADWCESKVVFSLGFSGFVLFRLKPLRDLSGLFQFRTVVRVGERLVRAKGYHASGVDGALTDVVVRFDVIKIHRLRDAL